MSRSKDKIQLIPPSLRSPASASIVLEADTEMQGTANWATIYPV